MTAGKRRIAMGKASTFDALAASITRDLPFGAMVQSAQARHAVWDVDINEPPTS